MIQARDRLEALILAGSCLTHNAVDIQLEELVSLARKVTPATMPPGGLRYSLEQGPLEALPSRFRLPFPSQDEMRLSLVAAESSRISASHALPHAPPHTVAHTVAHAVASSPQVRVAIREEPAEDDDYEGDFE